MILRLAVPVEHRLVTDGRTDRHATTAITRASYSVTRVKTEMLMQEKRSGH